MTEGQKAVEEVKKNSGSDKVVSYQLLLQLYGISNKIKIKFTTWLVNTGTCRSGPC
jgi:hypothetical protein